MVKSFSPAVAGLCIALFASPAFAAWETTIGPVGDGGGDVAVMNGEADAGRWIQLWCRGDQRRIAILVEDGQNDDPAGLTATIEIAPDTGGTWRSVGDFYRHDNGWLGLSYRNLADMAAIVEDIIGADSQIAAQIIVPDGGAPIAIAADARGSTKAGRTFAEHCFGAIPAAAPAQPSIDQQVQEIDEAIEEADRTLQEADEAIAEADRTLKETEEFLEGLPVPGMTPWKVGTTGEPPVIYALGEVLGGTGVMLIGCEVGSGQLLLQFSALSDMPSRELGATVLFFATTDFATHHILTQITQSDERAVIMSGTGPALEKIVDDLILGSQSLRVTLSDAEGNAGSERNVGVIEAGLAAARVREQCAL
jgi:hypothetical protein